MFYKSVARIPMSFYGVEFKPGDTKEVPKAINNRNFIQVPKPADPLVVESDSKSEVKVAPVPIKKKPGRPTKVRVAEPEIIEQLTSESTPQVDLASEPEPAPAPKQEPANKSTKDAEPESKSEPDVDPALESTNNESQTQ